MTRGPLGANRPFVSDKRTIIVLLGIDGTAPSNNIQLSVQETLNRHINDILIDNGADIEVTRQTVTLAVQDRPTDQQIEALGGRVIHVQQYDVKTELKEVSQGLVNATHNTVVEQVSMLGFNIEGTKTTVS